ncbi:hypothetical protein D779_0797 [Imhoffiella purpurea]|uniref:Uncharacterized protein n=1 Tax=Imhoffiella purpurea TaxID=1249627 RepID=W9V8L8_9GAMM|nr:hypothetical protein D779_0797 [Imhoffiella purpurea]
MLRSAEPHDCSTHAKASSVVARLARVSMYSPSDWSYGGAGTHTSTARIRARHSGPS